MVQTSIFDQIAQDLKEKQKKLMDLDDEMERRIVNKDQQQQSIKGERGMESNFAFKLPQILVEKEQIKSQGLLSIVEKTWKVAEELTENVLVLQKRQEETNEALHLLQSIQDIKALVVDLARILSAANNTNANFLSNGTDTSLSLAVLENASLIVKRYVDMDCIEDIREVYQRIGGGSDAAVSAPPPATTSPTILADSLLSKCPVTEMEDLIAIVTDGLMSAFDNAVSGGGAASKGNNAQEITAVIKLFPLIGKVDLGLDKMSAYVCGLVAQNVVMGLKKAVDSKNNNMFLDTLVLLFEAVAIMIDRQESIVEYHYGVGSMLSVIQRLQREADVQSGILLNSLSDARQLDRKAKEIKQLYDTKRTTKSNSVIFDNDTIESREIDIILNELSILCSKSRLFDRFIRMRAQDEIEKIRIYNDRKQQEMLASTSLASHRRSSAIQMFQKSNISEADLEELQKTQEQKDFLDISKQARFVPVPESIGIPSITKLASRVHEFTNNFVLLASFFMEKSIGKAIALDTLEEDQLTSSMVDDVFFVLKTTLMRGVDTGDAGCLCGLVNSVSRILEEEFMTLLLSRLSSAFSVASGSSSGAVVTATSTDAERLAIIGPLVNNIDQSCHFINQLCEQVEMEVKKVFTYSSDLEREQIASCLEGLTEYSSKTRLILRRWIENYFSQAVKPKIRGIVAGIAMESKYILSEEEYNTYNLHQAEVLPLKFMNQFERLVKIHQDKLTQSNILLFVGLVLSTMLKEWEIRILASKINMFGALRLDGEVRGCVARFSSSFNSSSPLSSTALAGSFGDGGRNGGATSILSLGVIRDLFARLSQICLVLGLEKPGEIAEMWGRSAGAIRWRLNATEVRKVLACRIELEFSNSVVNSLDL